MQLVTLLTLSAILSITQASFYSWVPILLSLNQQADAFFSLFRRPKGKPARKDIPEGPVRPPQFAPSNFLSPFRGFIPQMPMQQSWFVQPSNMLTPPQGQTTKDFASNPNFAPQRLNSQQSESFIPDQPLKNSGQYFQSLPDGDDQSLAINTEEAESFFTLLAETDENACISRLVCEMGADPSNAGDLGQTVNEIIGSLTDFPPGSKVSEYNEILTRGRAKGGFFCLSEFPSCDQETYNIMKSNQPDEAERKNPIHE